MNLKFVVISYYCDGYLVNIINFMICYVVVNCVCVIVYIFFAY